MKIQCCLFLSLQLKYVSNVAISCDAWPTPCQIFNQQGSCCVFTALGRRTKKN